LTVFPLILKLIMSSTFSSVGYFEDTCEFTPPASATDAEAPEFPTFKLPASAALPPSPEDSDSAGGRQVMIFSGRTF